MGCLATNWPRISLESLKFLSWKYFSAFAKRAFVSSTIGVMMLEEGSSPKEGAARTINTATRDKRFMEPREFGLNNGTVKIGNLVAFDLDLNDIPRVIALPFENDRSILAALAVKSVRRLVSGTLHQ